VLAGQKLFSQQRSSDLPTVKIEQIVNSKKKFISIPWARKGESLDTTVYRLNPVDTFIYAHKVSNLFGSGGTLPPFREFFKNYNFNYEASLGSHISPHLVAAADYADETLQTQGKFSLGYFKGNVENSNNLSFDFNASADYLLTTDLPFLDTVKPFISVLFLTDNYKLYGLENGLDTGVVANPTSRGRTISDFKFGIKNSSESLIKYNINFDFAYTGLNDKVTEPQEEITKNTSESESGLAAEFSFSAGKILNTILGINFKGRNYETPLGGSQLSPSILTGKCIFESKIGNAFLATIGVVYSQAQGTAIQSVNLDKQTFIAAPVSVNYSGLDKLSLFAKYLPELRLQPLKEYALTSPYISVPNILIEKIPSKAELGFKYSSESMNFIGTVFLEQAEKKGVVNSSVDTLGKLFLDYAETDILGFKFEGNYQSSPYYLSVSSTYTKARKARTDTLLPMTPVLWANSKIGCEVTEELKLNAESEIITEQNTTFAPLVSNLPKLPTSIIFNLNAEYRYSDMTFFAGVKNITNAKKYLFANYLAPGLEVLCGLRGKLEF